MEPAQLSGMSAKCGLSQLVRAVLLGMEGVSLSVALMELSTMGTSPRGALAVLTSLSSSVAPSW